MKLHRLGILLKDGYEWFSNGKSRFKPGYKSYKIQTTIPKKESI